MNKCPICGKEVDNWEHPSHLNSKQHRDAGKQAEEITDRPTYIGMIDDEPVKGPINKTNYVDAIGHRQIHESLIDISTVTEFDILVENFEILCKRKIIIGIVRVNAFSFLVNYIIQDEISDKDIKILNRLRRDYF